MILFLSGSHFLVAPLQSKNLGTTIPCGKLSQSYLVSLPFGELLRCVPSTWSFK